MVTRGEFLDIYVLTHGMECLKSIPLGERFCMANVIIATRMLPLPFKRVALGRR